MGRDSSTSLEPMTEADPLSDVLRSVRLRGSVFFHLNCRDDWAALAPGACHIGPAVMPGAEHVIEYHMLAKGACWIAIEGEPPLQLQAGEIVMLPHGDAHVVSSAPGVPLSAKDETAMLSRMREGPKPFPVTFRGGASQVGVGLPAEQVQTLIVCGFIACDLRPFNPLISAMPRLLHLQAHELGAWVGPVLEHAAAETGAQRAGSVAILQRLSEAVFVDGARRYLDRLGPAEQGWLGALRDRHVGRAITLMHADPAEPWTLEGLGERVGLSRSALHERFVARVGLAPMQYLTNWRMQCAARFLREGHDSVASVALAVGYDSEAAFARAFKRAAGLPPAAWRKAQSPSLASTSTK